MAWTTRFANLFRHRVSREIDEELRLHLELRAEELEGRGMPREDARREARLRLGNPLALREATRESDVLVFLETMAQDVRHGLRGLIRNPGFAVTSILTLALGIGATTAVLSVVDAVLLRPLPYNAPERLYTLFETEKSAQGGRTNASPHDFLDWRTEATSFESMAAYSGTSLTLETDGEPRQVLAQMVSAELFQVLGVAPALGRGFHPEENEAGRNRVILLSYGLFAELLGANPAAIGRPLRVNGNPYELVGVLPPGISFPHARHQAWVPLALSGEDSDGPPINRQSHYLRVVGRLKTGVSAAQAQIELEHIGAGIAAQFPDGHGQTSIGLSSLSEETVGPVKAGLWVLVAAAGFVLLLACANVTHLQLTRASVRQGELGLRAALGGGRGRLVRQLLTESAVLYGLGAAAGLLLAQALLTLLRALGPRNVPRLEEAALHLGLLGFVCLVVGGAALFFGLLPALRGTPAAPRSHSSRVTPGREGERLRSALLVAEVAVSLMLLVGAGLAGRSFLRLTRVELGFRPEGVTTFDVVTPRPRYADGQAVQTFHRELSTALAAQPLVEAVGLTTALPLSGQNLENSFEVEGVAPPPGEAEILAGMRGVSPGFLTAMGYELVQGRGFTEADAGLGRVAVVNEAFVRRYSGSASALGRRVRAGGDDGWATVVGVVRDVKHLALEESARPEVLLLFDQLEPGFVSSWARGVSFVVRSSAEPSLISQQVRSELSRLDSSLPLIDFRPLPELVGDAVAQPRFRAFLLGSFAGIALCLALVGIFGVTSYFVAQRRREIGVRIALGARRGEVLAWVLTRGGKLAAMGIGLGILGALTLTRAMSSVLFEVSPTDPATLLGASALLAAAVLLAAFLPARQAAATSPAVVLRQS